MVKKFMYFDEMLTPNNTKPLKIMEIPPTNQTGEIGKIS
jgi:hypothetical protein